MSDENTIGPIPRNKTLGWAADIVKQLREYGNRAGFENYSPQFFTRGEPGLGWLLDGEAPEVLDDASYGFPPHSGTGETFALDPEAVDVAALPTFGALGGAKLAGQLTAQGLRRAGLRSTMNTMPKHPKTSSSDTKGGVTRRDVMKGGAGAVTATTMPKLLRVLGDDVGVSLASTPPPDAVSSAVKHFISAEGFMGEAFPITTRDIVAKGAKDVAFPNLLRYYNTLDWSKRRTLKDPDTTLPNGQVIPGEARGTSDKYFFEQGGDFNRDMGIPSDKEYHRAYKKATEQFETDGVPNKKFKYPEEHAKFNNVDHVLADLTDKEIGDWILSGNPPQKLIDEDMVKYVNYDDLTARIDAIEEVSFEHMNDVFEYTDAHPLIKQEVAGREYRQKLSSHDFMRNRLDTEVLDPDVRKSLLQQLEKNDKAMHKLYSEHGEKLNWESPRSTYKDVTKTSSLKPAAGGAAVGSIVKMGSTDVLKNPKTKEEMRRYISILREDHPDEVGLRTVKVGDDEYFWPAGDMWHEGVVDKLGLQDNYEGGFLPLSKADRLRGYGWDDWMPMHELTPQEQAWVRDDLDMYEPETLLPPRAMDDYPAFKAELDARWKRGEISSEQYTALLRELKEQHDIDDVGGTVADKLRDSNVEELRPHKDPDEFESGLEYLTYEDQAGRLRSWTPDDGPWAGDWSYLTYEGETDIFNRPKWNYSDEVVDHFERNVVDDLVFGFETPDEVLRIDYGAFPDDGGQGAVETIIRLGDLPENQVRMLRSLENDPFWQKMVKEYVELERSERGTMRPRLTEYLKKQAAGGAAGGTPENMTRRDALKGLGLGTMAATAPLTVAKMLRKGADDVLPKVAVNTAARVAGPAPAVIDNVIESYVTNATSNQYMLGADSVARIVKGLKGEKIPDLEDYLGKLDWDNAVPGNEEIFFTDGQMFETVEGRARLGIPPKADDTWTSGGRWKSWERHPKTEEMDAIIDALSDEEMGNWILSGKPPKSVADTNAMEYIDGESFTVRIDAIEPVSVEHINDMSEMISKSDAFKTELRREYIGKNRDPEHFLDMLDQAYQVGPDEVNRVLAGNTVKSLDVDPYDETTLRYIRAMNEEQRGRIFSHYDDLREKLRGVSGKEDEYEQATDLFNWIAGEMGM